FVAVDLAAAVNNHRTTATGNAGMDIRMTERNPGEFASPYLKIATSLLNSNNGGTHGIVHSLQPTKGGNLVSQSLAGNQSTNQIHGRQYGRALRFAANLGTPQQKDWTLGGRPFARVPVRFTMVSTAALHATQGQINKAKLERFARLKIHILNQYYAGQGIEF